jgi:hypothetical protein
LADEMGGWFWVETMLDFRICRSEVFGSFSWVFCVVSVLYLGLPKIEGVLVDWMVADCGDVLAVVVLAFDVWFLVHFMLCVCCENFGILC